VGDVSWFRNCCAFKSIQQVNYITQQYDLAIEQVVHIRGSTSNNDVVFFMGLALGIRSGFCMCLYSSVLSWFLSCAKA
jgi:hypothetical protein